MINISKNKCVGCGICEDICPFNAITVDKEKGIAVIDKDKCIKCGKCIGNCPQKAIKNIKEKLVFAFGTDDKETIKPNDHIGMSKFFQIWVYTPTKNKLILKETRENAKYKEDESRVHGDPEKAKATASVLDGVDVLIGKIIGPNIDRLKNKFVPAIVRESKIDKAKDMVLSNINEIFEEKYKKGEERQGKIIL